jgi:predicted lipoprotein with Yx(FWY)xxD motif
MRLLPSLLAPTLAALLLAACGSLYGGSSAAAPAKMSDGVLVGANGMTLYTFDKDTAGAGKSACNGPCATLWPPLMAGASEQGSGAWSVVIRDDGSRQWAYKGKPVYYYQADKQAGDRLGDNFRDVWHVVKE